MKKESLIRGLLALALGAAAIVVLVQPGHAENDYSEIYKMMRKAPQPTDEPAMAPRPLVRKLTVDVSSRGIKSTTIKVNGSDVTGLIDTGASLLFLNGSTFCKMATSGMITQEDVVGINDSIDANGDVTKIIVYKVRVRVAGAVLKSVIAGSPMFEDKAAGCTDVKTKNLIGNTVWDRFDSISVTKSSVTLSHKYDGGKE